jgi:KEOPS complex subunit Cgi121
MEVVEGRADIDDVGAFVARLGTIGEDHGVTVQAFDARYVVDRVHLKRAVDLATRARERGDTIADDFGVEILLYAAGRRQINRALEMGVDEGDCPVVAVVVERETGGDVSAAVTDLRDQFTTAETLGDYDEARVREFFDVDDTELAATEGTLADAVRERVALLPVEK